MSEIQPDNKMNLPKLVVTRIGSFFAKLLRGSAGQEKKERLIEVGSTFTVQIEVDGQYLSKEIEVTAINGDEISYTTSTFSEEDAVKYAGDRGLNSDDFVNEVFRSETLSLKGFRRLIDAE